MPPLTVEVSPSLSAELIQQLQRRTEAEVRFDSGSRALYASDLSHYRQVPIGAVIPRSIDDVIETDEIRKELEKTEAVARKQGFAIAIGHPHPDTVAALREWIPEARARGFVLVPLSAIAKRQLGVTG